MNDKITNTNINSVITDENSNFVEDNRFYIFGGFDFTISKFVIPSFIKRIDELKDKKQTSIQFYIDSNGGYTHQLKKLLTLFEFAKSKDITIETIVFSHAYSCGSILAAAGTKGKRGIGCYAEHLLHLGSSSTGVVVNDVQLERSSDRVKAHFDFVRFCYKKYAKVKNLEKIIHDDNYFLRGQDIIDNGLADYIIS
jgi:ATP-dependent protease ClpP protease subunit